MEAERDSRWNRWTPTGTHMGGGIFKRTDFRLDIIEPKAERIYKRKGMWTNRQMKLRT